MPTRTVLIQVPFSVTSAVELRHDCIQRHLWEWSVSSTAMRFLLIPRCIDVEVGEGADGDRLEGRARPVGADLGYRLAEHVGDYGRDDRPANPALTGAPPATGEGPDLGGGRCARPRCATEFGDRHLLAAVRE